ncbi:hypothetical protein QYE76_009127 [Lolium multiflorum]|uniref:alpha,alpha-trehalose-phosphate synthase (UDP-forming) n=1 Tax=Lolium multiflorum TaxID=4521 RepID=A0AAD8TUN0_LOLMU|nr:hypothetical protein QYE76_009127 [Lolium multiflorum]
MLHAAPPLEVGGPSAAHRRCLLRDRGGHGAVPADPLPLYGDDAATTKFLLERILRGSSIAPYLPSSSASSSTAAVDADSPEREDEGPAHLRCLLRDRGGHGAIPADPFPLYGDDAATTKFLLERVLRGSGIAPYLPSSASSTEAVDADPGEREDSAEPVPSTQARGEETPESSGAGTPPATELHGPLDSSEVISDSRVPTVQGTRGRTIIVTNRLPVTANRKGVGQWEYNPSSGGLASALSAITDTDIVWVGWPGATIPDEADREIVTTALAEMTYRPVFLDQELMDQYYSGFCNNILWPLFHYIGLPQDCRFKKSMDFKSQRQAYQTANQMFADVVCEIHKEGDTIWCHDYHLMLLPMLLKKSGIHMKVGWFLHTPFPSPEVYRTLPNRVQLLQAVMEADLVGFQTYDHARHFVSACTGLLELDSCPQGIECGERIVRVDAFPIGIDAGRFGRALELHEVQEKITEFKNLFSGRNVILGVDRLDMIKGFIQKVLAFEKFLEQNNGRIGKVVLLQIAVPTRSDVPEYRKLASQVHELVARVNGRFGTLKTTPILHLDQTLDFHTLCALYAVTDVALITSLRDGMNLVSYEYIACQESNKGVLILSEFAGAAQSLRTGAIIVNPWDIDEVAGAIELALNIPAVEREKRHKHNYEIVTTHTAQDWAQKFLRELNDTAIKAPIPLRKTGTMLPIEEVAARYAQSKNRLLILGFHQTLADEPVQSCDQTEGIELKLNPGLKGPLETLCNNENTTVIVVSGYGRSVLDKNLGEYKMWLAAENGIFLRPIGEEWIRTTSEYLDTNWSDSVKKVFEYFRQRTPGSYQEERETSVVWSYKYADVKIGRTQAKDLLQHLGSFSLSNRSAHVVQGIQSIEVRPAGATKGKAVEKIIRELGHKDIMATPIDYVLCIGHFLAKDEDVYTLSSFDAQPGLTGNEKGRQAGYRGITFDLKPEYYFPCTVGREHSIARYTLDGTNNVVSLLQALAAAAAPADISSQS